MAVDNVALDEQKARVKLIEGYCEARLALRVLAFVDLM